VTFFNTLNDILFYKKGNQLSNVDNYNDFSPFLVNRWVSMYSPNMCNIVNDTMNRYHSLFDDKRQMYRLYLNLLPRVSSKYIRYIKKKKVDKDKVDTEEEERVSALAKGLELSKREINNYINYEREHRSTSTD
jgi:hypothetical protein